MQLRIFDWDGTNLPQEILTLPPGRYVVESVEDEFDLSPEEEAGILEGLKDIEEGRVVSLEDAMRGIKARIGQA